MKVITAQFTPGGLHYSYFLPPYLDVKVGDTVVVEAHNNFTLSIVSAVDGHTHEVENRAEKYVVDKVDLWTFREFRSTLTSKAPSVEDLL
jgi:hypothetical protein